jgi:hypothetical protein
MAKFAKSVLQEGPTSRAVDFARLRKLEKPDVQPNIWGERANFIQNLYNCRSNATGCGICASFAP